MINQEVLRDYEVSIWTLQDSFIAVLKPSMTESKGTIENLEFNLKNDNTLTLSFSLPMYIQAGENKTENPIWYNVRNGNLITDLRKIKVIFNKTTPDEGVFEFLITKVSEQHSGFETICKVECESLAFHELGKVGYKISLNEDTYVEDWNEWFENDGSANTEPHNNINYWCDKIFTGTNWSYEIQMDWSSYDGTITNYVNLTPTEREILNNSRETRGLRRCDKIYEDAYTSSWQESNGILTPSDVVEQKEKERLIEIEESNLYNIAVTIAETFGVFCDFIYEHDSNYHISARKVVFYNNFIQESLGAIDINYAYDTVDISREMEGADVVTKMFVKTLTDSNTESGLATIMDTEANKSQEDYLLDFDYLYSIGSITEEQYAEINDYELQLHDINNQLKIYENQLISYEDRLTTASAEEILAKNAIALDNERISATNDLLNSITNNTGVVVIGSDRPDMCAAIEENGKYYVNLRQKGILPDTVKVYTTYTAASGALSGAITSYTLEYDEFNNLTRLTNIIISSWPTSNQILYLTYSYQPQLYYDNIRKIWLSRLSKDTNNYNKQHTLVTNLTAAIATITESRDSLLIQKDNIIKHFERLMGPAIREGYWQPEDIYAKYGEKHTDNFNLNAASQFNDSLASIGWDTELFDEEQKNYYEIGAIQERQYYPCINLTNYLNTFIPYKDNLSQISFIFQDTTIPAGTSVDDIRYLRFYPIGSESQLVFLRPSGGGTVIPVLMLTGVESLSDISLLYNNPRIGILRTSVTEGSVSSDVQTIISNIQWVSNLSSYDIVYPRIRINSANLKNTEDDLILKQSTNVMGNYLDYYVLGRKDSLNDIDVYRNYITIQPEYIFKIGVYGAYRCAYSLSNSGLFMYLDALQVLKENAYPRVSYSITPLFVDKQFIKLAYKNLNRIVHINDLKLKFYNVQGYISELNLKLDKPWEDSIVIENYKTKFEDLFSNIVVQSEQMKKNSTIIGMAAQAFTTTGELKTNMVQSVMNRVDLNYAFNQGTLTIDEKNGIWGTSESGVVAFRGGGIFTATQKDASGDWVWNTGILPSGINASLITTGQLDTNLIRIFAGDDLKFQLNGDGLYAYRSWWGDDSFTPTTVREDGLDLGQYVVHNSEGLFLVAKAGTILNNTALTQDVNRVEISWDGLVIRDTNNNKVFYADTEGNLNVIGKITATSLIIGTHGQTIDEYVSMGGTNLFTGTRRFDGNDWLNITGYGWYTDGSYNGYVVKSKAAPWAALTQQVYVEANEYYTYSCWIKANQNNVVIRSYFTDATGIWCVTDPNYYAGNYTGDAGMGTIGTTWVRKSFTVRVTQSGYAKPSIQSSINNVTWSVCGIKFERGARATDWSENPGDIYVYTSAELSVLNGVIAAKASQTEVNELATRINTAEQQITPTAIVSTVRSSTAYQNDLGTKANVSTLANYSTITQTASDISAAVGAVQMGTTNLFVKTQRFDSFDANGPWTRYAAWTLTSDTYNGCVVATKSVNWNCMSQKINVESGRQYTYSCWIKAASNQTGQFIPYREGTTGHCTVVGSYQQYANITSSWQRVSFTFTVDAGGIAEPGVDVPNNGVAWYICGIKLERGNKATDWSAAPEELYAGTNVLINADEFKVTTPKFNVEINGSNEHITLDSNGGTMDNLTVDKSFYAPNIVEKYRGNATVTIGSNGTYKSLKEFADVINNKLVYYNVTVTLQKDLNENVIFTGITGGGTITIAGANYSITGSGSNATLHLGGINTLFVLNNLRINGVTQITQCSCVDINNCIFSGMGNSGNTRAMYVYSGATVTVKSSYFYNAVYLIVLSWGAHFYSNNIGGGNCSNYLFSGWSDVHMTGTRPGGTWNTMGGNMITPTSPNDLSIDYGSAPPVVNPTTTTTFNCTASKTAYGSEASSSYIYWNGDSGIRQGFYNMGSSGNNEQYGCFWFNLSNLSGKQIKSAMLTLTRISGYGRSSEVNVHLYTTPLTSASGNPNTNAVDMGELGTIANGETKTFTIPTSAINASNARGLMLRVDDGVVLSGRGYSTNYARFYSYGESNAPVLTVTYQ